MAKKRIVILGASAAARMTAYILGFDSGVEVMGFTDQDPAKWGSAISGRPVLGSDERLAELKSQGVSHAVIGLGNPSLRAKLRALLDTLGIELAGAVHPSAVIAPEVRLGRGVVVLPGAILADDPAIADNVFIGQGAVIGHGARVEDDCLVGGCSAIGADVLIGRRSLVGWGAIVGPGCELGADCILASGACVLANVPANAVMAGNPAKVVKYRA